MFDTQSFVLKGDICFSTDPQTLKTIPDGHLVCLDGFCAGAFSQLPGQYQNLPLLDCSGKLIVPGLVDLHVHAPQYSYRALGMDLELLEWLETHTFPEESKYRDVAYARKMYPRFVEDLVTGPNTRACIFATVHNDATLHLMDLLEDSGLCTMVGKVNMDRNSPDSLREADAQASLDATLGWLGRLAGRYQRTKPILTPRFVPSCTDELMQGLGQIQREYHLPVQSHLSENPSEIAWVQELCPQSRFYGDAYRMFGLFGGAGCPTIMAHCVHSSDAEIELMKRQGVFIAHCPASNTNLASGIAPVRRYLTEGIPMGLGSDVAGGTHTSIFRAMADAIQVSKLRWRLQDSSLAPLTASEAFYLGTLGGGAFFGKVGTFLPEYDFDALVIDDSRFTPQGSRNIPERLERTLYLSDDRDLKHKFAAGRQLF